MLHDLDILPSLEKNALRLSVDSVKKFSPDTLSIMEFKSQHDVDIAVKIYDRHPLLGERVEGTWNVKFSTEFHMTNDSHLFRTKEKLADEKAIQEPKGIQLIGKNDERFLPLCFGEHFWFGTFHKEMISLWIDEKQGCKKYYKDEKFSPDYLKYRCGVRRIASNTNERTLVTGIIPKAFFCTYGMETVTQFDRGKRIENFLDQSENLFLFSIFSSFILDNVLRQKGGMTSVPISYIEELPIPRLTSGNWYFDQLVPRAARLICTTEEFADLWNEVYRPEWNKLSVNDGGTSKLFDWNLLTPTWKKECGAFGWDKTKHDITDRAQLRCEIDALVAHLYGLNKEELEYILSTFPIVREKTPWLIEGTVREFERFSCFGMHT